MSAETAALVTACMMLFVGIFTIVLLWDGHTVLARAFKKIEKRVEALEKEKR